MKYLMLAILLVSLPCAYADKASLDPIEDQQLNFVLNNFAVLLDSSDNFESPFESPGVYRLVQIPDKSDDCNWISELRHVPSALREDGCPQDLLFLSLSEWGSYPDQHTFLIGSSIYGWNHVSTTIDNIEDVSDWQATILLEANKPYRKSVVKRIVSVVIILKGRSFTVEVEEE